jgi:hypothetical protein
LLAQAGRLHHKRKFALTYEFPQPASALPTAKFTPPTTSARAGVVRVSATTTELFLLAQSCIIYLVGCSVFEARIIAALTRET